MIKRYKLFRDLKIIEKPRLTDNVMGLAHNDGKIEIKQGMTDKETFATAFHELYHSMRFLEESRNEERVAGIFPNIAIKIIRDYPPVRRFVLQTLLGHLLK